MPLTINLRLNCGCTICASILTRAVIANVRVVRLIALHLCRLISNGKCGEKGRRRRRRKIEINRQMCKNREGWWSGAKSTDDTFFWTSISQNDSLLYTQANCAPELYIYIFGSNCCVNLLLFKIRMYNMHYLHVFYSFCRPPLLSLCWWVVVVLHILLTQLCGIVYSVAFVCISYPLPFPFRLSPCTASKR